MEKSSSQNTPGVKLSTTFVLADPSCFREVVQRLTGPSDHETAQQGPHQPTSKLHEKRQCGRPKLQIIKPISQFVPGTFIFQPPGLNNYKNVSSSPASGDSSMILRPSNFLASPLGNSSTSSSNKRQSISVDVNGEEEDKAIKERRFYLHPSPRSKPGYIEPELLNLFPRSRPDYTEPELLNLFPLPSSKASIGK